MPIKLEKKDWQHVVELAMSWLVALAMFTYGIAKTIQFRNESYDSRPIGELSGMELMWAFYGHSQAFPLIIGGLQFFGGMLLLFTKTRLIGGLFLSTILANIILQDIVYGVNEGALKAAIIYQCCLIVIFWLNRQKLFEAMQALSSGSSPHKVNKQTWVIFGVAFLIFLVLRVMEFFLTH